MPFQATHGRSTRKGRPSPTYTTWQSMRTRCGNANADNYPLYGGRGIRVCERWNSFEQFLADMGERPAGTTLDRIDNDGNYEPGNCRWATHAAQNRNASLARMLTFNGETLCVRDWAARIGINRQTLSMRLSSGWPVEKALSEPLRGRAP